ncbi:MAG: HIT family protein [Patescibacteria group bacterium]|nr:HIT family protein [Patescibacteria group bacterium]
MTLFTKIYNKEIPGYILTENKEFFVLLDKFPLQKGHVLIIPKQEIDNILDMDDAQYQRMMTYAKEIATKLRSAVEAKRIGFLIE